MFGKILGKKEAKKDNSALEEKISKMNLTDMRAYVKGNIKDFEVSSDGLHAVMKKLITQDENQNYYIHSDDMDSKKKKAFDLILAILQSKKLSLKVMEDIEIFRTIYKDIIHQYDTDYKQIYALRLEEATKMAVENLHKLTEVKKKMELLGQ